MKTTDFTFEGLDVNLNISMFDYGYIYSVVDENEVFILTNLGHLGEPNLYGTTRITRDFLEESYIIEVFGDSLNNEPISRVAEELIFHFGMVEFLPYEWNPQTLAEVNAYFGLELAEDY